ncbi:MAG TPA: hypothetical protein VF281_00130 [Candidatus Saccharimonadales bacterium]
MCTKDTEGKLVFCEEPVYATQGGGYATREDGKNVWHSDIPDFMINEGAQLGDEIPEEWSFVAVNPAAHRESDVEDGLLTVETEYYWD